MCGVEGGIGWGWGVVHGVEWETEADRCRGRSWGWGGVLGKAVRGGDGGGTRRVGEETCGGGGDRGKGDGGWEMGCHDGGRQVQVAANPPNQWLDLNECVDHLSPGRANDVVKMKIIVQSPC